MASSPPAADVAASVPKLTIDPTKKAKTPKPQKLKNKVVDSWEDEDVSSGPEDDDSRPSTSGLGSKEGTAAPPPTPVSPNYNIFQPFSPLGSSLPPSNDTSSQRPRPEKTDAVARRMIASALGVKAPKQTDEQKAYEKAIREKERKRREEERATERKKEEEAERARKAIWED